MDTDKEGIHAAEGCDATEVTTATEEIFEIEDIWTTGCALNTTGAVT